MDPLDQVTFDTTSYTRREDVTSARVWLTPGGDELGLFHFALPPNISVAVSNLAGLRDSYRRLCAQNDQGFIELEPFDTSGHCAFHAIVKVPQKPHGMTYLGSITIPFRDFSYVLKVQCPEHGATGVRETLVMDVMLGGGRIGLNDFDPTKGHFRGWMQDPYDPTAQSRVMRNLAEDPQYDARFPDHPLSRARNVLAHLRSSLRLSPELQQSPHFSGPDVSLPDAAA